MEQLLRSVAEQVKLNALVDIGITALLIYWLFSLIRGTRAVSLVIGVTVLFAVYAAARMPALFALIEGLWLQIGPVLNLDLRSGPQRLHALAAYEHHAGLVEALERKDGPAARRALVSDIETAADYILSLERLT